jgi:hypothetical protein
MSLKFVERTGKMGFDNLFCFDFEVARTTKTTRIPRMPKWQLKAVLAHAVQTVKLSNVNAT